MDFKTIEISHVSPITKERYIRDTKNLQKLLGLQFDIFKKDFFLNPDNLPYINEIISKQPVGNARKAEYLRSVCALLSAIHESHKDLSILMTNYPIKKSVKQIETVNIQDTRQELLNNINNSNLDILVRILSAMLIYNVPTDISTMIKSTINDSSSEYNFDTTTSIWKTNKNRYKIDQEFTNFIQSLNLSRFTTNNISRISNLFKSATGHTYSEYQRSLKEEIKELKEEKIDEDQLIEGDDLFKYESQTEIEIQSEDTNKVGEDQPIEQVHIDITNISQYYTWDYLQSILKINEIHIQRIKYLSKHLKQTTEAFDHVFYNNSNTINKIKELKNLSLNTKHNYLTAICTILDVTGGINYQEYTIYRLEIELELIKSNLQRTIPWFPNIYKKLYDTYEDTIVNKSIRIICLFIISNIHDNFKIDPLTEIGVLRPSDILRTRLYKNAEETSEDESYLNLSTKRYIVHESCTKNKTYRELQLNDTIIQGIQNIYGNKLPKYLFVTDDGNKYASASSISAMLYKYTDLNFDTIRSSYFTWRDAISKTSEERKQLIELCRRQGHQYSTAILDYKRIIDYDLMINDQLSFH